MQFLLADYHNRLGLLNIVRGYFGSESLDQGLRYFFCLVYW